jgi:glycosyltransferase involved in cell wall biosynthesis
MISVVVISKDEKGLEETLADLVLQVEKQVERVEILVIDASDGRLDYIRERHRDTVRWVPFEPPVGVSVSIPQQRNAGVRASVGNVIAFTDAGCRPAAGWLERIIAPILAGQSVVAGTTLGAEGVASPYAYKEYEPGETEFLRECSTINLAFCRSAFDSIGGFDESFMYGSDVDFSWRLRDAGYRIYKADDAVVCHDWGSRRRQMRRSYMYGRARARLYIKHPRRLRTILRDDPIAVAYPVFLLGLPLTAVFPPYPLLLLIPAWRNRSEGITRVLSDHIMFGLGVIAEAISI